MSLRVLPNVLTLFRMLAVGPLIFLLLSGHHAAALGLVALAGLSDLLDGYLARRFGWITHFGGVLDPLADKLLLVCTAATLAWLGVLPPWLVALMFGRDLLIVLGGLYFHHRVQRISLATPTRLSKWNTLFQIVLVVSAVVQLAFPQLTLRLLLDALIVLVSFSTVASGWQYVHIWTRKARSIRGEK